MNIIKSKEESLELFKALEESCKSQPKLHLVHVNTDKEFENNHSNFKSFIYDFITKYNFVFGYKTCTKDDDKFISRCNYGCRRSLGDLYRLVLTYFPDTTIIELAKYLVTNKEIFTIVCPDIYNIVFYCKEQNSYPNYINDNIEYNQQYIDRNQYDYWKVNRNQLADGLIHNDYLAVLD